MANTELMLCDYEGCNKPFAYRVSGFNLCAEHCEFGKGIMTIVESKLIAELEAKLAALDWTPITEDNGPPSKGKWLGWHPSWSDHVVMCHYDSDGEVCGEWCEELGEQSLPCNNPTHFKLLNPPQEPK